MIKKISKLTLLVFLMGMVLASVVGCQEAPMKEEDKYQNWEVDWDGYRPSVKDPSDEGNDSDDGNVDESPDDTEQNIPAVKPVTYTKMLKSNTANLNIRSAPTTSASVVGKMDKGDMVRYEGLQNGWYKTVYKEKTAYIYAGNNYVSIVHMKQGGEDIERVIAVGEELLGHPYVWGSQRYHWGNGKLNTNFVPGQFDCSALMQYIFFKGANVLMDLNTRTQVVQGEKVEEGQLRRGDVMFFTNDSRYNNTGIERVGHVALYLGDNYILHTASDYAVIEEISAKRWSYFIVAKRFI